MLWQKEKTRILRDHEDQINQLRKSIEIIEDKNSSLRRKLSEQSDDLKLEKMKVDLKKRRATYMAPGRSHSRHTYIAPYISYLHGTR